MVDNDAYAQTERILGNNFEIVDNKQHQAGWRLDADGRVSVEGDMILSVPQHWLPLSFSKVLGSFNCSFIKLQTLDGFPDEIEGDLNAGANELETLKGFPSWVGGNIMINSNKLTSLKGLPERVPGDLEIQDNPLTSLEHLPRSIAGWLTLTWSPTMPLLRTLGALHVNLHMPDEYARSNIKSKLSQILNSYAGKGKRVAHLCAKELITNGFEKNARW